MDIMISYEQGALPVTVFHLRGELNAASYEQLQTQAEWAIGRGTCNLVLDLADMPYLSSAGLRALNHIFHRLRTNRPEDSDDAIRRGMKAGTYRSPHLKLARPTPRVHEVLDLSGVNLFLEVHPDLQNAIASFR